MFKVFYKFVLICAFLNNIYAADTNATKEDDDEKQSHWKDYVKNQEKEDEISILIPTTEEIFEKLHQQEKNSEFEINKTNENINIKFKFSGAATYSSTRPLYKGKMSFTAGHKVIKESTTTIVLYISNNDTKVESGMLEFDLPAGCTYSIESDQEGRFKFPNRIQITPIICKKENHIFSLKHLAQKAHEKHLEGQAKRDKGE